MNLKKIILLSLVSVLLIFSLVYFLFLKSTPVNQELASNSLEKVTANKLDENTNNTDTIIQVDNVNQSIPEATEKSIPVINQIVNQKFPDTNLVQLNSFLDIASQGEMEICEDLSEKADECKYYFSVYQGDSGLCGDITDKTIQLDCYKEIAVIDVPVKFEKCKSMASGTNVNCLRDLFWAIDKADSCSIFTNQEINQFCLDSVNLKDSVTSNKEKCSLIKDQSFKDVCEQFFAVGDFDKDGLSDKEETEIGTNPYSADTDQDGYTDKAEFSGGYNPCGDGQVPSAKELFNACAKLY